MKGWENRSALATGQKKGKRSRRGPGRRINSSTNKLSAEFPVIVPNSSMEFERDWRRHCVTLEFKLSYLKLCGADNFRVIFKTDLDVGLLSQIVQMFAQRAQGASGNESEDLQAASFTLNFLEAVIQTGRFALNVKFLDDADKANTRVIFNWLASSAAAHDEVSTEMQASSLTTEAPPDISMARISAVQSLFGA